MALSEALAIGHDRSEGPRLRFHARYRVPVSVAPVDFVEVITPFRAVVLAAEARARAGQPALGLKEAQAVVAANGGLIRLQVEMTFHPMNTFVGVPPYQVSVRVGSAETPVAAERVPRFGPRVEGAPLGAPPTPGGLRSPGTSAPLTGGTLLVSLPEGLERERRLELLVRDGARVVARIPLDLGAVR